jgi:adenosylcobyric acid synthase
MTVAPCLMLQGTASGVGKSLLTAALCRILARQGYRVAPFKAQNMSLNAAVTADGGEIGRAQAAQAEAAGIEPTVDMNPILLKPEADDRSQVVVRGVATGSCSFREYGRRRAALLPVVEESLVRLRQAHDLVVIEGAGSPAEINLNEGEIVNMRVARLAEAPVLLVGDIDRGGVFAAFVGTLALLPEPDRARVAGFIVNKFRGDHTLLGPGLDILLARTGLPTFGVVPYLEPGLFPAEDSLDLDSVPVASDADQLDLAVVRLPRIANFDDVEPLAREPGVRVRYVRTAAELGRPDLVVLPGSKCTIADLQWLRAVGLDRAMLEAARGGTPVLGLCGGYQMLGVALHDPDGVESPLATAAGLGLLDVTTVFAPTKATVRVRARVTAAHGLLAGAAGLEIAGYEIHAGRSDAGGEARPFTVLTRGGQSTGEPEGAMSADGAVLGTYLHGIFASAALRRALLAGLAHRKGITPDLRWGTRQAPGARYDRLADAVAAALDLSALAKLVRR